MPTRHFAILLPILAKNTKLSILNLGGNQLVDNLADVYDLYDIDEFN